MDGFVIALLVAAILGGLVFVALYHLNRAALSDELDRRGLYAPDDPRYRGGKR